ncbi:hypothetical protein EUZ85_05280 [Hahella sp. KA22]|uniref:hypothetical protein n=1 Tax=Hahella sp. KA22 TaxID=1628392 RepID=UPI000FDD8490|nr:hypothetical protein [Hahella sp. KA22]AZZ90153.1 hypothetical protein ENC22_02730 [Hahella sp. KA22]QAY53523.1 hypothetical protein EUZ85_05280 [Hahella sp. KA22]
MKWFDRARRKSASQHDESALRLGSRSSLSGPDFKSAPVHEIQLSRSTLSLSLPVSTASQTTPWGAQRKSYFISRQADIYKDTLLTRLDDVPVRRLSLAYAGWGYCDHEGVVGEALLEMKLWRLPSRNSDTDFRRAELLKRWLLSRCEDDWRELYTTVYLPKKNMYKDIRFEAGKEYSGQQLQYPVTMDDLMEKETNGLTWLHYEVRIPGTYRRLFYLLPLTRAHLLQVSVELSSQKGPSDTKDTNFMELVKQNMAEFLNSVCYKSSETESGRFPLLRKTDWPATMTGTKTGSGNERL